LHDKKPNERLDDEQQRRADVAERQDTTLAGVRDLAKETNRVSNHTSKRIFGALQLGWLRGLGPELKFLTQKTYSMNVAITALSSQTKGSCQVTLRGR
jgi:hypothetical protein